MPTIAIVGAGPGLGASLARRFGRRGFQVALLARDAERLDALARDLAGDGVEAEGFPADVGDRPSLIDALRAVERRYGTVDVLEYSPAPSGATDPRLAPVHALDVTVADIQPQVEHYVYGAVTAARQVLPGMIERGSGTLLFTTGASSTLVFPPMGNVGIAGAALRNWALALNASLADKGIYAAHVPLATFIGQGGPETSAETIAEVYWELYTTQAEPERLYSTV
ncbi:SDR family NAD(P)-dependent oxidoreductase [Saccharopolyspora cebuensis]|uniref:SDR family NAD(P)-dependent oxidoreductase n=1 Tax=Saccharopolyspora cebuensis TaxID=418759 RepID=A0ABV4CFU3_9PSEU